MSGPELNPDNLPKGWWDNPGSVDGNWLVLGAEGVEYVE